MSLADMMSTPDALAVEDRLAVEVVVEAMSFKDVCDMRTLKFERIEDLKDEKDVVEEKKKRKSLEDVGRKGPFYRLLGKRI